MTTTITCSACNTANQVTARFCMSCGTPLWRRCHVCGHSNRAAARFCRHCGARQWPADETGATAAPVAVSQPFVPVRILEAHLYRGCQRMTDEPKGPPVDQFDITDRAFWVCMRLANLDQTRAHQHLAFVQFFTPDGRLYRVRQRAEAVVFKLGQAERRACVFGLRIAGTHVVDHIGRWRVLVYIDDQRLTELSFEVVG